VLVIVFPRVTRESEFSHASCAMNQNFANAQQKNRNTSSSLKNIHIAATRRTMSKGPSLLARLQDRSTKLLFGEDGGTGESFEIDSHIAVSVRRRTPRELFIVLQFRSHNFIVFNDTDTNSFYDIVDRDIDGNDVKMDKFRGNVLCVVNVASK
jgi:hypothetical protein